MTAESYTLRLHTTDSGTYESIAAVHLDEFIRNNYDIKGNVEKINDAQIVLLGENHLISEFRRINGIVINSLNHGSAQDALLVETEPFLVKWEPKILSQHKFVDTKTILTTGWDNTLRGPMTASAATSGALSLLLATINSVRLASSVFYDPTSLFSYEGASSLVAICAYATGVYAGYQIHNKIIDATLVPSNQSMCQAIEQQLPRKRKIYVCAGSLHLSTIAWLSTSETQKLAVRTLHHYLRDKKYIILCPRLPIHLPESLSERSVEGLPYRV